MSLPHVFVHSNPSCKSTRYNFLNILFLSFSRATICHMKVKCLCLDSNSSHKLPISLLQTIPLCSPTGTFLFVVLIFPQQRHLHSCFPHVRAVSITGILPLLLSSNSNPTQFFKTQAVVPSQRS